MKRIRINAGRVGLVFRNGDYKRVINEGVYWVFPNERVIQYDMAKPFYSSVELNVLLKDEGLRQMLEIVEVKDGELVLQYEGGIFKSILTAGRHAFWKGLIDYTFTRVDLSKVYITEKVDKAILERRDVLSYVRVYEVASYEKGVLYIDGEYVKTLDRGTYHFWRNATSIRVDKVDMRQLQLEVSGQEILTRDKAALRVNFMVRYQVADIEKALIDNKDYEKQLYVLMQLALREFVGTLTLDEILERKEAIATYVLKAVRGKAENLGVTIKDSGVRDIILPGEVKDIMNQVLIAQKQAQANVIMRREETASTRSLLNTAKLMEDNAMLFKLKEMEYVEKIADKIGEISLAGNGQLVDQLRGIFAPNH